MFRTTVRFDERADVPSATAVLKKRALRAGLKPAAADEMAGEFREILVPLIDSGRKLKAQGSRVELTRKIVGAGYAVELRFHVGQRISFFEPLLKLLRGH